MERITGLSAERLDHFYWADRHAFDLGSLTGQAFWQKLVQDAGLNLNQSAIDELVHWDVRMWMTENPVMLDWQLVLKQRGIRTAIVSNMGDTVHRAMERELGWLSRFDVLVWSYQLGIAKPDPAIYRYVLKKLGTEPEETLFVDDRPDNIDAAIALGMKGVVFSDVVKLRADIIAQGLDKTLPLPG
jgi:putative hydrolase of the HAD superfamily